MPAIPPTLITTDVSDPPNRGQEQAVFSPKMDNFLASFDPLTTEQNALATWMEYAANFSEIKANEAEVSATEAAQYSEIAAATANFQGEWDNLTGALNQPASVWHDGDVWLLIDDLANVTTVEPGTDPSTWVNLTAAMSGYTNPMTTANDLIRGGAAGVQTRFAAPTTSGVAYLLRYDVDTTTLAWVDEDSYLGGGGGGSSNILTWVDLGERATSASESVTVDFSAGMNYVVSMQTANTTGTLTLNLTNLPTTSSTETATMIIMIRRGGRKPISIAASGFTINYIQGAAPIYTTTSGQYDVLEVLKKFSSTQLDVMVNRTGIY